MNLSIKKVFFALIFSLLSISAFTQSMISVEGKKEIRIKCGEPIPKAEPVGKTSCKRSGEFRYSMKEDIIGECPSEITRTWTFTDPCGNITTWIQWIFVEKI